MSQNQPPPTTTWQLMWKIKFRLNDSTIHNDEHLSEGAAAAAAGTVDGGGQREEELCVCVHLENREME